MNTMQRGLITLLKSAVTGQAFALPEGFDMTKAYAVGKRHHMSTLLYEGAVICGVDRGLPVMQKLFQNYVRVMVISERQMVQVEKITAAFQEAGIDHMPLKGCVMKGRYPKPELRVMGDADILIRPEQYDRIVPILEQLNFREKNETDHELVWIHDDLYLELHKRLIPSYNKDFHVYFGDSWRLGRVQNGSLYSMTPEDEMIYLFTHYAKHFRDGGIGCRHVLDLWVYLRSVSPLNDDYIRNELKKFGLLKFYLHTRELMDVWFGDAPETEMSDFLTDVVFHSGSFGLSDQRVISRAVRDNGQSILGINSRMLYLWQTAFPSVDVLKSKYTVLKKAPWLLPVVWLVRPFYKVLFERETLEIQEKNLQALSEEGVAARRAVLHEIGLDYNF